MGLKVWLPLITDEHNQGASNAMPTSAGVTFTSTGKIGTCGYFSGASTSYIDTNYSTAIGTNDFSIALWLKLPAITSGSYFAICTSKTATAASAGFGIYWNYSQKKFLWSTADGSAGTEIWMATAIDSIVYDKWIHLVMVRDNNDSKKGFFYINGTRYELASVPVIRNITTDTKMHIGKCTNGSYPTKMYVNDFRIYDHALSAAEVREISQGLVLHYRLDRKNLRPIGTNLVTGVTKGGQTSLLTDNRIGVVTSGVSADTYFTVNLSESITNGTTYYLSCDVSGVSSGQYWGFPLGSQSNTSMPSKFYNGHNEYVFTANDINWGTNRLFLDDNYRNDYAHPASFYNFVLIKNPTFEAIDESGYGYNSVSNAPITSSTDTPRYNETSYFGAYNTPNLILTNPTTLLPALSNCTITWWGKYDTVKTLLLTGHTTGHYLAASNNNTYYHGNAGTITFYKDGVAGTYKCAADGWHFFTMTGVNISSWTALKLNGYGAGWPLNGYISDLRIYCTTLDADAIRQLYEVGAKVDNKGNLHTFEINEFGANQLTKTGIMKDYMVESYKTLPDGSHWQLMMFHYVDEGRNMFTSTNASYCNDFGLYSRLRDIDKFKYTDTLYEFYAIQDDLEYRWTQTNAPTTSSSPGTVTTVSGYNNPSVGLARNGSNTYLGYNSWWGACGCWTVWQGNAIPGFGGRNCTKYLALYARISNSKFKLATQNAYAENFIEL